MNCGANLPDTCAAQVQRLLSSRALQNAESLRRLLEYLARKSLEGQPENLKEYTVGIEAFGKSADYDPRTDSSVRVQVSKLRQKLEEYYNSEGRSDPLLIDLPKGHFKLVFRQAGESHPNPDTLAQATALTRWRAICIVLTFFLIITAALAVHWRLAATTGKDQAQLQQRWSPALEAFWQPYLRSDRPIMIAIGTPLFDKVGNAFFRDPTLNDWEQARTSPVIATLERELKTREVWPSFNYTAIGEARGIFELAKLFTAHNRELLLRSSNELSWEDISRNNVIFVGPAKYNFQIRDLPVQVQFIMERHAIQNLRPREGEVLAFPEKWTADHSDLLEGHALVTRVPGLHGEGEITILAGTSTEGTRAAVEYVTQPEYAHEMASRLGTAGALPTYFQEVIRVRYKSHVPIEITYVTHRVL